ncbi:hypothetical protein B7P43_G18427 [Cryptotermes secundus]|uniref:Uncharacterized protein n=1 Tax=Cryptotermes secundus TaxID=105785 RepID=A0A2J7RNJ1_9NEOP|nr:hypothetical protein B7P43_G18427 [Cryptotermes secundus]
MHHQGYGIGGNILLQNIGTYLPDSALSTQTTTVLIIFIESIGMNKPQCVFDIPAAYRLCVANGCVIT